MAGSVPSGSRRSWTCRPTRVESSAAIASWSTRAGSRSPRVGRV